MFSFLVTFFWRRLAVFLVFADVFCFAGADKGFLLVVCIFGTPMNITAQRTTMAKILSERYKKLLDIRISRIFKDSRKQIAAKIINVKTRDFIFYILFLS